MRYRLLSVLGPAALWLILIGVGPFQISNSLQIHVIGIILLNVIVNKTKTIQINIIVNIDNLGHIYNKLCWVRWTKNTTSFDEVYVELKICFLTADRQQY